MATGIEALGLAFALLPVVVNQLDNYARGIEQIKVLKRFHRTLEDFALELGTQNRIFLNSLEQVLDGVVDDDNQIRDLIGDPDGEGWKEPSLQIHLTAKLGHNYPFFFGNVLGLHAMLKRMAGKLDVDMTKAPQNTAPSTKQILLFLKAISKAVFADLLQKITSINSDLRTLLDQSAQLEVNRKTRNRWHRLLPQFRETRKNAEGLFRAIVGGSCWSCLCQDSHGAHLQFQANPLTEIASGKAVNYRVTFYNTNTGTNGSWICREVEFEPYEYDRALASVTNPALPTHEPPHLQKPQKQKVRFEALKVDYIVNPKPCNVPPILDFCSVLCRSETQEAVGFVTDHPTSNIRYNMHFIKCYPKPIQLQTLQKILPNSSRRHRLYIAAGLACGVIQYHGNWLKEYWDSSDIHLPADHDEGYDDTDDLPPSNLYLPWSLNSQPTPPPFVTTDFNIRNTAQRSPLVRNRILFPLGLALTELSLRKSITSLRIPQDKQGNEDSTRFITAFRVLNRVQQESGSNYRDAVHSCLCWSGVDPPCLEDEEFEGRVFHTIVAPLLNDLAHFEGVGAVM
ncbi:hypothetical protein BJX99DRAFT_270848 [Aspergillus californicus]